MSQGGIFGTGGSDGTEAPSHWATANRVYIKYCTSDLWSGDAPASKESYDFAFRGSRVVPAVIASLVRSGALGGVAGQRMLFGGCSAGAIGALNNIETVASLLPASVELQGFFDGAALLDIEPRGWDWSPDLESLQLLMANMSAFTAPVFPEYCDTLFPGEVWKCWFGQARARAAYGHPLGF